MQCAEPKLHVLLLSAYGQAVLQPDWIVFHEGYKVDPVFLNFLFVSSLRCCPMKCFLA